MVLSDRNIKGYVEYISNLFLGTQILFSCTNILLFMLKLGNIRTTLLRWILVLADFGLSL